MVVEDIPRACSNLGYPILVDLQEDWDHMEAHMEVDYPVQEAWEQVGQDLHSSNNPDMLGAKPVLEVVLDCYQVHSQAVVRVTVEQGVPH